MIEMVKIVLFLILPINFLANGANILGIYFHAGPSHCFLGRTLFKELARRGHNVTMASPFPLNAPFPNYTDVHLTGVLEDQLAREGTFMKMNEGNPWTSFTEVLELNRAQTKLTLTHPEMKKLLQSGTKFDVIIMDLFINQAIFYFGKLFKAPIILLSSHGTTCFSDIITGNPAPPSYVPHIMVPFSPNMTFLQRTINSVFNLFTHISAEIITNEHLNLIKDHFNDTVTWNELKNSVALVLSNGHYSFESPKPFLPNIIPIGGFHVGKPKKLPSDLQDIIEKATNGVIYFSFGSNMKTVLLPVEKQKIFIKVFSRISYTVLWKWESDDLPKTSKNVIVRKWFPQNDILAHRNVKLFISHGGLLSVIEALYHGVPILGIPIFGDQLKNIATAVYNQRALKLDLQTLTEMELEKCLLEMLENPKYSENSKKGSEILRDQPLLPMDNAVFWIEHVIRHKGGEHLRNFGVHLTWYQYFLLDVISIFLIVVFVILLIFFIILKRINRSLRKKLKSE